MIFFSKCYGTIIALRKCAYWLELFLMWQCGPRATFVIKQDNSVLNWNPERKRVDPPYFSVDELLRDTDSEEEDETKKKAHKPKDKTQAKLAWLQEGGDIMDFLDPSASRKVLGNGNTRKDGSN